MNRDDAIVNTAFEDLMKENYKQEARGTRIAGAIGRVVGALATLVVIAIVLGLEALLVSWAVVAGAVLFGGSLTLSTVFWPVVSIVVAVHLIIALWNLVIMASLAVRGAMA